MSGPVWDESPLSLSVVKNVWAQPTSTNEDATASNSLKDLVDDFPSTIPSMNDLKTEEDGHSEDMPGTTSASLYPQVPSTSDSAYAREHAGSTATSAFAEQYPVSMGNTSSTSTAYPMPASFQPSNHGYMSDHQSTWQRPIVSNPYTGNKPYPSPTQQQQYSPYSMPAAPGFANGIWQQPAPNGYGYAAMSSPMNSPGYVHAGLPGASFHSARNHSGRNPANTTRGPRAHYDPAYNPMQMQMQRDGSNGYLPPMGPAASRQQQYDYGRNY